MMTFSDLQSIFLGVHHATPIVFLFFFKYLISHIESLHISIVFVLIVLFSLEL